MALAPVMSLADPARPSCDEVLKACDSALEARKLELGLSNTALLQRDGQVNDLKVQLKDTQDSLNAWYRNPYIMIGLGLLTGAVLFK